MKITSQVEFQFAVVLEPVLDMLAHKKLVLKNEEWLAFVSRSKERIISNPTQFFGSALANDQALGYYVDKLFQTFLAREIVPSNEVQ